jgi:hypothetical protein
MSTETRQPVEGFDFSTLYDQNWEAKDFRQVSAPASSLRSKSDAKQRLSALVTAINREVHGEVMPEALLPLPPGQVAGIIDRWENSPQRRPLLPLAREAAHLRAYIRRLQHEEQEATISAHAGRIADWRRAAAPEASDINRAIETIEAASEAEEFLAGLAPQILKALEAHDAAQRARRQLRAMRDAADTARQELIAAGEAVPDAPDIPDCDLAPDDTLRIVEALKPLRARALSADAMRRPVYRGNDLR